MENSPFPSLPPPPASTETKAKRFSAILIVSVLLVGLIAGGLTAYIITYSDFNSKLTSLENQLGIYSSNGNVTNYSNSVYLLGENVSLSALYSQVKTSVVVIQDLVPEYNIFGRIFGYSIQQGSGFVTSVNNQQIVVTNNHVIEEAINATVTFSNGDSYPATVIGTDPRADLAILSVSQMPNGVMSLSLANSDLLQVGDPVVAVGSPYGLSGTLTTGVISALGRSMVEDSGTDQNDLTIADIIQTSTAINPGNSGGPLITYRGEVVGITTAGISNSESLGFAIP